MHEMTRVWQRHNGVSVADEAISLFFKHGGDYDRAYEYNINTVVTFGGLSIEQQANIVMDYFDGVQNLTTANSDITCDRLEKYEEVLQPVFPAIRTPRLCR